MRLWAGPAAALALLALFFGNAVHAELPVEHVTILKMPPDQGHRLYVLDYSLAHGVDGKVRVLNGDTLGLLGQLSNGFFGDFLVAADGGTLYNATTFFSRGDHGIHTEVLEYYDPKTLLPVGEVELPPKRAQSNGISALMAESAFGTYIYVQNATPATSVTVVDVKAKRVLADIPTAGCYGVYPAPGVAGRFSTLCGDGAAVTIGFDAQGHETSRKRSAVLFDPDGDALFLPSVRAGAKTVFMSFLGNVHSVDFSGDVATQEAPWSVLTGTPDSAGWRPGGVQMIAYSEGTGMLYVAMHPNGREGSHKDGAKEIWKIDFARHAVVARGKSSGAVCLQVSAGPKPVLFTQNADSGSVGRYDGDTLAKLGETQAHLLEGGGPISVQ